ncbi:MAG: dependent oxidoreductase [Bacteroidota bacterium]|nr:dependent oxidoreductase [Bacteroidota bacterium]
MLSWFLLKQKQQILVIDDFNPSSASNIASGISNPITGRKFVKTWLADELFPFAQNTYQQFEQLFGEQFFHSVSIIKLLDSVKAQNDWSARCASPEYHPYLTNDKLVYLDPQKVKNDFGGFEISGATRLEVSKFLSCYRNYLKENKLLFEENFSVDALKTEDSHVTYKGIASRKIVFCEGASAIQNPYFKFLPFQLAKGECLILNIEDFYPDKILNGEVLIMPTGIKNEYYIGATHQWNFDDDNPSEIGKNELLGNLSTVLSAPYQIKNQLAAIRPTVKDRRPFIGFNPEFKNVGIFNGMGTKGISLAPYFAEQFVQHLIDGKPLTKEVDIRRFL